MAVSALLLAFKALVSVASSLQKEIKSAEILWVHVFIRFETCFVGNMFYYHKHFMFIFQNAE